MVVTNGGGVVAGRHLGRLPCMFARHYGLLRLLQWVVEALACGLKALASECIWMFGLCLLQVVSLLGGRLRRAYLWLL